MNSVPPEPQDLSGTTENHEHGSTPSGVILERFKRMKMLPPHIRSLEDEFFVQSFLRKKRCDL